MSSQLLKSAVRRTVAPRELSVGDIEVALEHYLSGCATRDLTALLSDLKKDASWKTAPKSNIMAKYQSLYKQLVSICPAGVLPPKRTTLALVALHLARPCNFTGRRDSDWADELSLAIRAGFAKFRELLDLTAYARCMTKASSDEKHAIDDILSYMKQGSEKLAGSEICVRVMSQPAGKLAGSEICARVMSQPELSFSSLGKFFEDIDKQLCEIDTVQHETPRSGLSRMGSSTSLASTTLYSPHQPDRCGGQLLVAAPFRDHKN